MSTRIEWLKLRACDVCLDAIFTAGQFRCRLAGEQWRDGRIADQHIGAAWAVAEWFYGPENEVPHA